MQSMRAKGFVQRNRLPLVTVNEHDWLTKNHRSMAAFTRTFTYRQNEYIEDTSVMAPSRPPKVTEIWVGARSMGCIAGESAETETEGLSASQLDQEDSAELTDLQTLLYHDPATGQPLIEDPDTGEYRPVRNGDCITIVRGSNDDLDALFLDEPEDPRQQNDSSACGSDHRWSDRFRANTDLEQSFLNDRRYVLPNSALSEEMRWQPDDFAIRRAAQSLAEKIITRRPEWSDRLLALTDEAEERIRSMADDLAFEDGTMVRGYFVSKDEFFGTIEENVREFEKLGTKGFDYPVGQVVVDGKKVDTQVRRSKARPQPMDFDAIPRETNKSTLEHRRRLHDEYMERAVLGQAVTLTYSEAEHRAMYEGRAQSVCRKSVCRKSA